MRYPLAILTANSALANAGNQHIIDAVKNIKISFITDTLIEKGVLDGNARNERETTSSLTTNSPIFREITEEPPIAGADFSNNTVTGIPDSILEIVVGYGCYCNFLSGEYEKANGRPADGLDQICKGWHTGYFCARIDNEECSAMDVDYVSVTQNQFDANNYIFFPSFDPFTTAVLTDEILADCEVANNFDGCKTQACLIDSTFVAFVMAYVMESEVAGQFPIPGTPCPVIDPTRAPEHGPPLACCGTEAERFPFLTDNGNRACCGTITYEVALFDCCDAGSSLISVSCP